MQQTLATAVLIIDRVSYPKVTVKETRSCCYIRVNRAVAVKGKILPGQVNLSNLKKQLV
jgi:hypothetical protein